MKHSKAFWRLGLLIAVMSLIAAACSPADTTDTTDTTEPAASSTTEAPEESTTTGDTGTTEPSMDFGDPVTLNLGHPFPAGHPIQVNALEPLAQAVNEATNGTVTIEFQPGGALAPPPATFENTVAGGQEMG